MTTRTLNRLVVAGLTGCAALGASAAPALAADGTVHVNAGYTLTVRAAPSNSAAKVRTLGDGAKVKIVCQTTGDKMTGRYGTSTVWDKLSKGGYVTDTYVYTGSDGRVAPNCSGSAPTPTPTPTPTPSPAPSTPASIKLKDDYPYATRSPNGVDPWSFYYRECTSFVAYRLNKVMKFSNGMKGGHFGNAENWDDNARAIGMKVDKTPTPGSVMVRNSGTYGHVAMVAKVKPGKIYVEQYNAGGTHTYSKQWLDVTSVMAFIHP